jgi:hypothetical protein
MCDDCASADITLRELLTFRYVSTDIPAALYRCPLSFKVRQLNAVTCGASDRLAMLRLLLAIQYEASLRMAGPTDRWFPGLYM